MAGFLTVEEYVRRCQNTVAQYFTMGSLLDLFEGSERAPGVRVGIRWWEQAGIDLEGAREKAAAVAEEEVERSYGGDIERLLDWDNGRENST